MARSIPKTQLAQAEYAARMGINPISFEGCDVPNLFQETNACDSTWPRFAWQTSANTSREDLAIQIVDAEAAIAREPGLGYNLTPIWVEIDMPYPKRKPGMANMRNLNGKYKVIPLQQGKIIAGGRRAVEFIQTFPVVYADNDGDGFPEDAKIDVGNEFNWREVKVYHKGTSADPKWEIRPIRRVDKESNILHLDSWLFVDPDLTSAFPQDRKPVINIANGQNLVEEVDVYLEYNDIYQPSCQFIWTKSSGDLVQDGYMDVLDKEAGIVRPVPAVFEYGTSCTTSGVTFCYSGEPDRVKLYFYAGNLSSDYMNGYTLEPMEPSFAEAVKLLATARLDKDLCGCTNIVALGQSLREDMALVSPQGNFLAVADAIQECPFGTRRGEWLAWNKLKTFSDKFHSAAII